MDALEQMYSDRVASVLVALDDLAVKAESSKAGSQDARRMVSAFDQVIGLFELNESVQARLTRGVSYPTLTELQSVRDLLSASSGTDRSEGEALAAQVRGMLQAGIAIDPSVGEMAQMVLDKWSVSAPSKGTRVSNGTRASAGNGQGVHVEMRCSCGWSQHDSTNTNSARWAVLKHLEGNSSHPTITVKPSGRLHKDGTFTEDTNPDWARITCAVKPVAEGETAQMVSDPISDGSVIRVMVA